MNALMKKIRKDRKGFTLVEVIVVLVILAILAAIAVPSMVGFIDEANQKALAADTRAGYIAAQVLASEEYAKSSPSYTSAVTDTTIKALINDAGITGTFSDITVDSNGRVTAITYTNSGNTCTIADGEATFGKTS